MSTQTIQTAGGKVPRVNLMPPEIAEAAQLRQIQAVMGAVVLLAIVIIGGLWYHGRSSVTAAKNGLAGAQAAQVGLQSKLSALDSVKQTEADLEAKQLLLTQAMGAEVRWSYLLNDMSFRLPSGVYLTSMNVNETSSTPGQIGTVSFVDVGTTYADVAATLEALAKERGFTNPIFGSSSEALIGTHKIVNFSTTVGLTPEALSGRYAAPVAPTPTGVTP